MLSVQYPELHTRPVNLRIGQAARIDEVGCETGAVSVWTLIGPTRNQACHQRVLREQYLRAVGTCRTILRMCMDAWDSVLAHG